METKHHCRTCAVELVVGVNWAASRPRKRNYVCNICDRESVRKYRAANPEAIRAKNAHRRARKRNNETAVCPQERAAIRDMHYTASLATRFDPNDPMTVEHIVPVALGGPDRLSNLTLLPRSLNSAKGAMPPDVARARVPGYAAWLDGTPYFEQITYRTRR